MKNRILSFIFCIALLLGSIPIAAETTGAAVTATDLTLTPGGSGYLYINASDFADVASLDVEIYYDASVLKLMSHTNGSFITDALTSVNHDANSGKISLSVASLTDLTGDGRLLALYFQALSTAVDGSYPITVAVGDAYSSSFVPVSVKGVDGKVTVDVPKTTTVLNHSVNLSSTTLSYGDTLTVDAVNSWYYPIAGATFVLEYDPEVFEVESVALKSGYATDTAIYSINTNLLGQIRISYINTVEVSSYNIYTAKLRVIGNADTQTTLKAIAKDAYKADLSAYAQGSATRSVAIHSVAAEPDYPDVSLKNEQMTVGRESLGTLSLEKGAGVAAADFVLTYDPTQLSCLSVVKHPDSSSTGAMLVINPNYKNGTIRFSYLNESGYEGDIPMVQITWQPVSASAHAELAPSATGVYDLNYEKITLEYVKTDDCIYDPVVTPPACTEQGYTTFTCSCGKSYVDEYVSATGHSHTAVVTPPTCTEKGYTTHTCHCGDSYVDSYVDAKGHGDSDGDYRCDHCHLLTVDVNGDDVLNITDVNELLRYLAGISENEDYTVDLDRNGVVNVTDLNIILVALSTVN